MAKKLISFVIIMVLCLSSVCFASGGKVESSAMDYAPLLKSLGITDDSALMAETVTRATFLKSAVKLLGNESLVSDGGEKNEISDVSAGSENYAYINFAMNAGVVSKSSAFRPDDAVTYNEAVKILVNVLGYSSIAEAIGGYPVGYAKVAAELDLTEGISSGALTLAPADYVTFMVNALEASPAKVSQIVDGNIDIKINAGKPLMEISFNVKKGEGLVDATTATSLYSASTLGKDEVRVNNTVFECDFTLSTQMLGAYCEYYYAESESSSRKSMIFMIAQPDTNNIYSFEADELEDTRFEGDSFSYFASDSNEKTIKLSPTATYIYNGVIKAKSEVNTRPLVGSVTLIDNDADRVIDVVKITDYKTGIVSAVSTSYDVIATKDGGKIELDSDEDYITVVADGKAGAVSDITADKIITYYQTPYGDGFITEIYVSSNIITAKITEMSDDRVVTEEAEYKFLPSVQHLLKIGANQKLYVDSFGYIADVKALDEDYVYGWLYGAIDEGMDSIKVRIFTENNRWVDLYLDSKIKTESGRIDRGEWYKLQKPMQLVRYRVNDEAVVTELFCAIQTERFSEAEKAAIDADTFRLSESLKNAPYRYGTSSLENKVFFASCGKIFYVPDDETDKSAYDIINIPKTFAVDSAILNAEAYDMDLFGSPKAMVIRHSGLSRSYDDFMVFDRVTYSVNKDGNENMLICGMFRGFEVKFPTEDLGLTEVKDFNKGDILKINFSTNGEVTSVLRVYDYEADSERKFLDGALYARTGYICGEIVDVDFEHKRVILDYGDDTGIFAISANTYVKYDSDTEECKVASMADLMPGAKIFARMEYLTLKDIAIIG